MNDPTASANEPSICARFFRWLFSWRTIRRTLVTLACFATVVAVFYTVEDWRGKRAWENCKRELEAKGVVLDWNAYIPPPVPDDQNFFKAPGIAESDWVGRGSHEFGLTKRLSAVWQGNTNPMIVAELTVLPPRSALNGESAGTVLHPEESSVRAQAEQLIRAVLGPSVTGVHGHYPLIARPLNQIQPAAAVMPLEKTPTTKEILEIFPATIEGSHLQIKAVGSNTFHILLDPLPIAAGDYLQMSDPFAADFDTLRDALKRPCTRMDGDYSQPFAMPIPNFITMRTVAQMLAERAKCYLLLGEPDKALRELTLVHELCRVLESRPTGKPMTLVAAMINVAVTGLYTDTVADGIRLRAWREPQLVELEKQLSEINLLPDVFSAFEQEPVAVCHDLETLPPSTLAAMMGFSPPNPGLRKKLKNPTCLLLLGMPRGWVYQNMASIAMLRQKFVSGLDPQRRVVLPDKVNTSSREIEQSRLPLRPYTFMTAITTPNYVRTMQTLARNQTRVGEALLACALERYHLVHDEFPATLDALVPQFIETLPPDIIGGQPLHYRRTDDGKCLLYSVGWNERDDGGVVALNPDGKENPESGDWVWRNGTK